MGLRMEPPAATTTTALSWKQRCAVGFHRYRGKEHGGGCATELEPHWHVICRRCHDWWLELMLFDPRAYDKDKAAMWRARKAAKR